MVVASLAVAWAILTGLLIGCGEAATHSTWVTSADRRITGFMVAHRTDTLTDVMRIVTAAGTWIATLTVVLIVVAMTLQRRLPPQAGIAVAVAFVGQSFAVNLTKSVVGRPRPPEPLRLVAAHGWSFPSGHMANAVVVFASATALAFAVVQRRVLRAGFAVVGVTAVCLVGFSRVELGAHWTSDVVASAVWTSGWLLAVFTIVGRPARHGVMPPG